jgi:phage tail sheath protein FI
MPTYLAPGIYLEEKSSGVKPIQGVSTSTAAFVGVAQKGPVGTATLITSFADYVRKFGSPIPFIAGLQEHYLAQAVQHFFAQGGSRCYVVRVVHYTDINSAASIQATRASAAFGATRFGGAAAAGTLTVDAINEGEWGESLSIEVRNSSKFSVRLAEDVAGGAGTTRLNLLPNTDVQVGSVLFLVQEVIGIVQSVSATNAITFQSPLTIGTGDFAGNIANATRVFTPEFDLITTTNLAAPVAVVGGVAPTGIILTGVTKEDGSSLRVGNVIHFAPVQTLLIVTAIRETVTAAGQPAMEVQFAAQNMPALAAASTGVYARDFTLIVREDSDVVETHPNLSLASTNAADFVDDRLSVENGESLLIRAQRATAVAGDDLLMNTAGATPLVNGNDGLVDLTEADLLGSEVTLTGLHALDMVDDISILSIPPSRITTAAEPNPVVHLQNLTAGAIAYVENRKDLFYIIDPSPAGGDPITEVLAFRLGFSSQYAGIYFPWLRTAQPGTPQLLSVPPSGAVAGVFARTDVRRGVHKAPAGIDTGILSVASGLDHLITRGENDIIYPQNINAIRALTDGITVWGSRTISADPDWVQVNVRRLFIFLEQSIERGTQWVVFEPNDPKLWKSIERNVRAFLRIQWIEGKLVGATEEEAFFVKCDAETNPPEVVDAGQVITEIGAAPSRPAEFVIFRIRQFAGTEA